MEIKDGKITPGLKFSPKIFLGGGTLFLLFWKGAWSPLCEASKGVHNLNDGYDINHQFRVE